MLGSELHHCSVSAQESERRPQESRDPQLCTKMENECAETCEEQCGGHGKSRNYGDQDGGSEHGEHVLEAEGEHLAATEGAGIVDGLLILSHIIIGLPVKKQSGGPFMTGQS